MSKIISFSKLFSDSSRTNKHLFLTFIETYSYITTAIGNLLEIDIVHYDIKEENILYSIKYENPLLIDFGLSIPIKKLDDSNLSNYFYVYAPDYYLWPIDVHILNYLINKEQNLTIESLENLISSYISHNSGLEIFTDHFKERYKATALKFFSKYINLDKNIVIKELLQFYKTWDLYALSIMYLKFFKLIFREGFFDNIFIRVFSQLLLTNIAPDPNKRLTQQETLEQYRNLFYINEKPEEYLTLIYNLNYDM